MISASYWRSYAADRFRGRPRGVSLVYVLLCPALPLLITWRASAHASRAGLLSKFFVGLPWLAALTVLVCLEKTGPAGMMTARVAGVALVGFGALLLSGIM